MQHDSRANMFISYHHQNIGDMCGQFFWSEKVVRKSGGKSFVPLVGAGKSHNWFLQVPQTKSEPNLKKGQVPKKKIQTNPLYFFFLEEGGEIPMLVFSGGVTPRNSSHSDDF